MKTLPELILYELSTDVAALLKLRQGCWAIYGLDEANNNWRFDQYQVMSWADEKLNWHGHFCPSI